MSEELRTDFTAAERNTIINGLRDEYGDREFSDELVLLEMQDLWRKGCHHLDKGEDCHGCGPNGECGLIDWEKRHPEYKDDALAKRLKELKDELRSIQNTEIEQSLLSKGYVKVNKFTWLAGHDQVKQVKLYMPGSRDLMADAAEEIERWKAKCGHDFRLTAIDLSAKSGTLLRLTSASNNDLVAWEIAP